MIRILVASVLATFVWLVAATQVPSHLILPVGSVVVGATVTQAFGCTDVVLEPFDPNCPSLHFHAGIDLAAPAGTEVYSATGGIATTGFDPSGAGNFVAVRIDPHVRIVYCHLAAFRVGSGQEVTPGQLIGLVGASGLATGPHVHLQVNVDGLPVDPATFLGS
ncbi:MAG TPA: M23 family metallopeptidase [Candidatus Limnocylindrales bacterium]|nr:M23 family metallopeptidase [Candidatus Limnocylindrales bacterium]